MLGPDLLRKLGLRLPASTSTSMDIDICAVIERERGDVIISESDLIALEEAIEMVQQHSQNTSKMKRTYMQLIRNLKLISSEDMVTAIVSKEFLLVLLSRSRLFR